MNSKKGFTLAEMLGIIVIIGLLILLITPAILTGFNNKKESLEKTKNSLIYNAAGLYIDENQEEFQPGTRCIQIKELIEDGKLTSPVLDKNNEKIDEKTYVKITIDSNGSKTYEITETCTPTSNLLATIDGGGIPKSNSQTLILKAQSETEVVAYYFGKKEPKNKEDITNASPDAIVAIKNSGLNQTVTEEGTYYFAVKDETGNFSKKSITIRKYQVATILEKIEGTSETYTNENYTASGNVETYYIKNNTKLQMNNIYAVPIEGSADTFKGYSVEAPSSTAQTLKNEKPKVSDDTTVYYNWFNRTKFNVLLTKPVNGEIKAETIGQKNNSVTAKPTSSGNINLKVKYGDKVKATATPNIGYGFKEWTGGYVSGNNNEVTGNEIKEGKTITATFINNPPTIDDIEGGTTPKSNSQTLILKAQSETGVVAYYFGKEEPTNKDDITNTSPDAIAAIQNSGLNQTVTEEGTYWFAVKDETGTFSKKSITIRKYQVASVLETIPAANNEVFTNANYSLVDGSTKLYLVKDGTTLKLSEIYTKPAGGDTFKGYTTNAPSATQQNPLSTNPKITNDTTTYYMWFTRKKYTVTITKPINGQIKVETIGEDNSIIVKPSSSGDGSLSVKYGDKIKVTATPNEGYSLKEWTGGYVSGNDNPIIGNEITTGKTIAAIFEDSSGPTAEVTSTSTLKSESQTATLKCNDEVGVVGYYWGTEPVTSTNTYTSITSTKNMSINKTVTQPGIYYLSCKDIAGNVTETVITKEYNSYTVNNMLQNTTGSTYTTSHYTQASSHIYLAPKGTVLTTTSIYKVPEGSRAGRYNGISLGAASETAATPAKTNLTLNGNSIYSVWFTRNVIYFKYKPNEGTITTPTTSGSNTYDWSTDDNGYIGRKTNGGTFTNNLTSYRYGVNSINLFDYNNESALKITKSGSVAPKDAEWICDSGCTTANMTFTQAALTLTPPAGGVPTDMICNAKNEDCTVVVKVNWKNESEIPSSETMCNTLTYNGTVQTLTKNPDEEAGYTWTSGTTRTNAGSQEVTATLKSGYVWNDRTTGTKKINCSIGKATPVITLSASELAVELEGTKTFTATVKSGASNGTVAGTLTVVSQSQATTVNPETSLMSNIDNNGKQSTEIVTGISNGTSNITVNFTPNEASSANYNSAAQKIVVATVADRTAPTVDNIGGGTEPKKQEQPFELKCEDSVGVTAWYFGTNENPSDSEYTNIESIKIFTGTANATSAGTYYLKCKDSSGNIGTKEVIVRSLVVHNMLLNLPGEKGSYTTANYTRNGNVLTYYIKSGTSLTSANVCTTPEGASSLLGYNLTAPSTAPASLTPSSTNVSMSANRTVSCWYNRKEYDATITKSANVKIKAETKYQQNNSVTVNAGASENKTLKVRHGDKVIATATPNSGYNFTGWGGGYVSGTDNPIEGSEVTSNITIMSDSSDSTGPTAEVTTTKTLKSENQTATLKCNDEVGVVGYYWGTEPVTPDTVYTPITSTPSMNINQTVTQPGIYYLSCKDIAGNVTDTASTKEYNTYTINNMLQNITGSTYTNTHYTQASSHTYLAPKGTALALTSIYTVPDGSNANKYKGASVGPASSTPATPSTTNPTLNENSIYSIWFTRNTVNFRYKTNNGTITTPTINGTTTYDWTTDENGYINRSVNGSAATILQSSYRYGNETIDLENYNNNKGLYISKNESVAPSGAEWICENGCVEANMTFTQDSQTLIPPAGGTPTDSICNAKNEDCTVVIKVNWKNRAVVPTAAGYCNELTYNGQEQTLTKNAATGYTFSNNKGTNAGEYTITANLASGYVWSDGSAEAKTFKCSIGKATPTITITPTSGTTVVGVNKTFNEKANTAGKFKNTSETTSVATVNPAESASEIAANTNTEVTVIPHALGSSTITVTFTPTDTNNWNTITTSSSGKKTYTLTVADGIVPPTAEDYCKAVTYTGSEQTLTNAVPSTAGYTFTDNKGTNAGNYTVKAKLNSGNRWTDNTTEDKTFVCSVAKATPEITITPTSGTTVVGVNKTFNEKANTAGKFKNTSETATVATVSPAESASEIAANTNVEVTVIPHAVGNSTITITFTPTDTNNWNTVTATSDNKKIYTATVVNKAEVPTAASYCNELTYNGQEQTLTKNAAAGYTFSNNKGTNAGEYTITATLESGYRWSDNTSATKTFKCSIEKATPTITITPTSGTTVVGVNKTFNEKANTAGKFKNTSETTSVATVNPAESTSEIAANTNAEVTVIPHALGSSTITVTFTPTDTNNWNTITTSSSGKKTYTLTVADGIVPPTAEDYCKAVTYTGSEQTLTNTVPSTAGYTFTDNKGTNAGNYTVKAKLNSGNRWTDNTTEDKTFVCSVAKATPVITLSPTSLNVELGSTKTFTATVKSGASNGTVTGTLTIISQTPVTATVNPESATITSANNSSGKSSTETVNGLSIGTSNIIVNFTPNEESAVNYKSATQKTLVATVADTSVPEASITGGTEPELTSQSFNLSCTDSIGITSWYFGMNESPTTSEYTTIESTVNWNKTINVDSDGTYYLKCKDASGNEKTTDVVVKAYERVNILLKLNGTEGTYTTTNYAKNGDTSPTFYIKSGTNLTSDKVCKTLAGASSLLGYSLEEPSETPSTLTPASTNITINNNKQINCWYNRKKYTVKVNSAIGGKIKAETKGEQNNDVTVLSGSTANLTVRHGDTIKVTATPTSGYTFDSWSGYVTGNTTPIEGPTVTANLNTDETGINGSFSDNAPTATISGGTSEKQTNQSFDLKCEDGVGIAAYYWGKSNTPDDSAYTSVDSTSSWTGTGNATSAGTYYLKCKDASGNVTSTSVSVRSLAVNNMLLNLNGTKGEYTTANYTAKTSLTYYIKNNTTLTSAKICSAPEEADSLLGYNIAAPSTTPATLTPSSTNLKISANRTVSCWYNRKEYTVTLTKPENGKLDAETVEQQGNAASVDSSSSGNGSLTVRYGDQVKATATPTSGYTFGGWSGGYVSGTNLQVTGEVVTANKTIATTFSDITAPTAQISGGTTPKKPTQTYNLSCEDGVGVTAWYFGTNSSPSDSDYTEVESTNNWTGTGDVTSAGTYYLKCKDKDGNIGTSNEINVSSITVQNMLLKLNGTKGAYTTSDYARNGNILTYFITKGTTLTSANVCTKPTGATALLGYNLAAPSTTPATLTPSSTNININSNITVSCWYDRNEYNVTLTKPANGQIDAETTSQQNNTASVNQSSSGNASLTVRYGDKVKVTAIPNTGYSFGEWSGGYVSGTTNPITGAAVKANQTISATFTDSSGPEVDDIEGGNILKVTEQTVNLKCRDESGIAAYYFGKTQPVSKDDIVNNTATDITALQSASGLNKTISEEGTYYFACKDVTDKYNVENITIRKYQVASVLETIAGTSNTTYTSSNYAFVDNSTKPYIIKDGATLTLANLYEKPEGGDEFRGYTTSAPSSEVETPSVINPEVAENDTTVYYMWFTRLRYNVTITKPSNGQIKAETVGQGNNSITVTPNSSSNGNITVKYKDKVKATATANSGYTFTGWGGYVSGTTNPIIGEEITSNGKVINGTFTKNKTTITLKKDGTNCTDCNGYTVHLSTSSSNDTSSFTGTTTTDSTLEITGAGQGPNSGTKYYVWVGKDSNHKSNMVYSGVSINGGLSASGIINFYTLTMTGTNTTVTVNETAIANNSSVVVLGGTGATNTSVAHSIGTTPTSGYTFTTWSVTNGTAAITSPLSPNTTVKVTSASTLNSRALIAPTFNETIDGEVEVTYPTGCSAPFVCQYNIDDDEDITVFSSPTTVGVGEDGTITATISDGVGSMSATYSVIRNNLYVSSTGNDTTGYGTVLHPYATIARAYQAATATPVTSTIYVMDNINHSNMVQMSSNKDIILTSCTKSGSTCPYSSPNTVLRGTALTDNMITLSNGTLTLNNITVDGNGSNVTGSPMIHIGYGSSKILTINDGTTLRNARGTTGGAAILCEGRVIMNGGTITNNTDSLGGAIRLYDESSLVINNGMITNNRATEKGGGIYSYKAVITMNSGSISGNSSVQGGGVYIFDKQSSFHLQGGNINSNTTTGAGAGIYNLDGTFEMTSGNIQNNTITGGTSGGGAIHAGTVTSITTLTGGNITGNSSRGNGGGIYNSGNLTVGGTLNLKNNTSWTSDSTVESSTTDNIWNQIGYDADYHYAKFTNQKANFNSIDFNKSFKVLSKANENFGLHVYASPSTVGNSSNVDIYTYSSTSNQNTVHWVFYPDTVENGEVYYHIESKLGHEDSGQKYNVINPNNSTDNHNNIQLYTKNTSNAQRWKLQYQGESSGKKYHSIVSYSGKCMDIENGTMTNLNNVQLYSCNNTAAQIWRFVAN